MHRIYKNSINNRFLFKGAICRNRPPVELKTNKRERIALELPLTVAKCSCRQLVSSVSSAASGLDW